MTNNTPPPEPELRPCPFEDALDKVMIGGNHLASSMLGIFPPTAMKSYDEVLAKYGQPWADMWIAWKAIINLRNTRAEGEKT